MSFSLAALLFILSAAVFCLATVAAADSSSSDSSSSAAEGGSGSEFPLVYVCVPITVVGCIIVYAIAFFRPRELILPGGTVFSAQEREEAGEDGVFRGSVDLGKKPVYNEY